MNFYKIKISIFLFIVISAYKGLCQDTKIIDKNNKYLDSLEQLVQHSFCEDSLIYYYPDSYNNKKLKDDKLIIDLLNTFFDDGFKVDQINDGLKKFKKIKISRNETMNGLIRIVHITIYGNYVRAELTLDCLDDVLIRRKIHLRPNTYGRCGKYGQRILDFKLLKNLEVNKLNFLIRIRDYDHLEVNEFFWGNLSKIEQHHTDYKFYADDLNKHDAWTKNILLNQYNSDSSCCYSFSKAHKDFVLLLKNGETQIILNLLYSPNYFYAMNAMEAVIYLASINKVTIDSSLQKKIVAIKQSSFEFTVQKSNDVFETYRGYNSLGMSNDRVIIKYQSALPYSLP